MAGFKRHMSPNQSSYNSVSKHQHTLQWLTSLQKHRQQRQLPSLVMLTKKCSATIQNLCVQMGLSALPKPQLTNMKSLSTGRVLKPSSLLLCVQMNEPEKVFKSRVWNSVESENSSSVNIWDYSDAEDTPTSYWSTLPNWYFTIIFLFMFMFVFFYIYETWYCGCGFHGIIVQAIATGHREMYVCYYEGNTARRVKVGGCSIVLTLYQCKLFSYLWIVWSFLIWIADNVLN